MNITITGANGFIGRGLVFRLLDARPGELTLPAPITKLTLVDIRFHGLPDDPRIDYVEGSIADGAVQERAFARPTDYLFHIASVPGGTAEKNYELGRQINVHATLALLERMRAQSKPPIVVFTSSVGVLSGLGEDPGEVFLPPVPGMTYSADKLIGEILINDFTRRGWIDGRSVRVQGALARPPEDTGQLSIYLSDCLRNLSQGKPFVSPVPPQARTWLQSWPRTVDNLIVAATLDAAALPPARVWTLPPLSPTMAEMVDAIAALYGADVHALVTYRPDARITQLFGMMPEAGAAMFKRSLDAGFQSDGTMDAFIRRALTPVR